MGCKKNNSPIDEDTFFLLNLFEKHGYKARVVGGAVRNFLLGREFSDVDVATSATPSEIIDVCKRHELRVIPTGIKYGSLSIFCGDKFYEVTSLRRDIKTFGRRAEIKFSQSFRTDSNRRDFTMNAIYMDRRGKIYDYHGGIEDLHSGNVRFIGNARKRIVEDYLRIFRYFRFVAAYGNFKCNPEYLEIISKLKSNVKILSSERIVGELLKILEMPRSYKIIPPMRKVLDELFSLKFDSLDAAAKLNIFDSLSGTERLAMLLKFSRYDDLVNKYNFSKTVGEMLALKAVPREQIFSQLKRVKKEQRIFYAKFSAVAAHFDGSNSKTDTGNFLEELLNFCQSGRADFQLKANDLVKYHLTSEELKRTMMATREFWIKNIVSSDECKNFAAEYIKKITSR